MMLSEGPFILIAMAVVAFVIVRVARAALSLWEALPFT